jgi:hypothetical protein
MSLKQEWKEQHASRVDAIIGGTDVPLPFASHLEPEETAVLEVIGAGDKTTDGILPSSTVFWQLPDAGATVISGTVMDVILSAEPTPAAGTSPWSDKTLGIVTLAGIFTVIDCPSASVRVIGISNRPIGILSSAVLADLKLETQHAQNVSRWITSISISYLHFYDMQT